MEWLKPTLWGAFGGLAIEALDYITAVRKHRRLPWHQEKVTDPGPLAYGITTVLRITIGAGLACAAACTAPISPWWAFGLGAAAPALLEKLPALIVSGAGRQGWSWFASRGGTMTV
ncbi:hypothetical protein [Streptomyces sp. AK02-01A]|uniref:hypothetical protein n=1 Tax=Streptomyces sp. AK02-01A TaxID=3028648 RepID=UPI0029AA569F|nr:hypothetical protein [Streptomyces sp. AK02-01A]MDX3855910.1 hypothetical protein [Streptomyces sp. AK02-01A]